MGKYYNSKDGNWYEGTASYIVKKVWVYFDIDKEETGK